VTIVLIRVFFTKTVISSFIGGLKAVRITSEKLGSVFVLLAEIGPENVCLATNSIAPAWFGLNLS
jgi:hypothetical protein